jgi:hypothetical protein
MSTESLVIIVVAIGLQLGFLVGIPVYLWIRYKSKEKAEAAEEK